MSLKLKRVVALAAVRFSTSFTSSAWRSQKTWNDLTENLRAERSNFPQEILPDEDDSFVDMDESSTGLDETQNSASRSQKTWSDLTAELRAERTNFQQVILPDEDDSFVDMDESSTGLYETPDSASRSQKTWSDLTAELRAERIKFPQIIVSDEDEEDGIFVGMDESSMDLDEAPVSSSSSVVCGSPSKFKRPVTLPWKKELANSVSLTGMIDDHVRFEYMNSGKPLAWTSLSETDKNYRFRLCFWDELANIAIQHLRKNDRVHVLGELKQQKCKMWIMGKDLKFIQNLVTPNSGKHRFFKITELWKALFDNPFEWYDHREHKMNQSPDFEHRYTGEALWIEDKYTPEWVKRQLMVLDSKIQFPRKQSR